MSNKHNVKIIIAVSLRFALFDNLTKCESIPKIKIFFGIFDGVVKDIPTQFSNFFKFLNFIKLRWSGNNLTLYRTNSNTSRLIE